MKRYGLSVVCLFLVGLQVSLADWTDDFSTYADDTEIQAISDTANGGMYNIYLDDSLVYANAKFKPAYANEIPRYIKISHDYIGEYRAPFAFDDFSVTDVPLRGTILIVK